MSCVWVCNFSSLSLHLCALWVRENLPPTRELCVVLAVCDWIATIREFVVRVLGAEKFLFFVVRSSNNRALLFFFFFFYVFSLFIVVCVCARCLRANIRAPEANDQSNERANWERTNQRTIVRILSRPLRPTVAPAPTNTHTHFDRTSCCCCAHTQWARIDQFCWLQQQQQSKKKKEEKKKEQNSDAREFSLLSLFSPALAMCLKQQQQQQENQSWLIECALSLCWSAEKLINLCEIHSLFSRLLTCARTQIQTTR